jgi:hypothetical protein
MAATMSPFSAQDAIPDAYEHAIQSLERGLAGASVALDDL